ncbi:MAG: shikimate dehydrogenase [Buchnera aphidicola (Schlechtendalia chinensis)]
MTLKKHLNEFSVFGNPINHTKSPYIHQLFSIQTNIVHNYDYTFVPINKFHTCVINFFSSIGIGANVTIPFKEEAFLISDTLTKHAQFSRSVNTLKKLKNGKIIGDNTDGRGILYDLRRLKFIKSCDNVLVIGSGGASRGIIFSLLSYGCNIFVFNRTIDRAKKLVSYFKKFGSIFHILDIDYKNIKFNVVINTIANIKSNNFWNTIASLIKKNVYCYDINYSEKNNYTTFLSWCKKQGALFLSDGIGMLVSQAAYSFLFWHGIFPKIEPVILRFR